MRKLLKRGNEYTKEETTKTVKILYDNRELDSNDVVGISRGTIKQDELFEYVGAPEYLKEKVREYDEHGKDDFGLSR